MNRKKLIYSILKELEQGNEPKRENYELELEQWGEIAELIKNEGYVTEITITRGGQGNKVLIVMFKQSKLTMKGIEFLEENNGWAKTYKGLKEIRDWIRL
ncbi:YjcQ family protein [Piscibacillus sp. B03]|uniref:YjcQ family protein n=1 Tax=Piscibacillus sp. B03 TaxID=3457430 RepID=UPI003FCE1988